MGYWNERLKKNGILDWNLNYQKKSTPAKDRPHEPSLLGPYPYPLQEPLAVLGSHSLVRELQPTLPLVTRDLNAIAKILGSLRSPLREIESVSPDLVKDNKQDENRDLSKVR
jgi:hypothetical protein